MSIGLHMLAFVSLYLAAIPQASKAMASAALLGSSAWHFARRQPSILLRCHDDGHLEMLGDRGWTGMILLDRPVLLPGLSCFRYRLATGGWIQHIAVWSDAVAADDLRRFRVWLRWRATGPHPASDSLPNHGGNACRQPRPLSSGNPG